MRFHKHIFLIVNLLFVGLFGLLVRVSGGGDPTCPSDSFPTRLPGGSQGRVISSYDGVLLHDDPFRQEAILGELAPGVSFKVADDMLEPTCAYEMLWIYVETPEGVEGWATEVAYDQYLLEPLDMIATALTTDAFVPSTPQATPTVSDQAATESPAQLAASSWPRGRIAFISDVERYAMSQAERDASSSTFNPDIYLMDPDGNHVQRLTEDDAYNMFPDWSPDGTQIAFTSNLIGNENIYVINADGSNRRQLTESSAYDADPDWSPDGTQIAFTANDSEGYSHVSIMLADGSNVRRLTDEVMSSHSPAWSPDGTQIAFTSRAGNGNDIYAANVDGSNLHRITSLETTISYLAWSPDGTEMAFVAKMDNIEDIYVATVSKGIYIFEVDGQNLRRLTTRDIQGAQYLTPTWSPDGTEIAFAMNVPGRGADIYVMAEDGSNVRQLMETAEPEFHAAWSSIPSQHTVSPTPFPTYCPASPPSRIQVGIVAGVTHAVAGEVREDLRVRDAAGGERIDAMPEGTEFRIIGGYECVNDQTWWQIQTLEGTLTGWVTEGAAPDDYYIEPIRN